MDTDQNFALPLSGMENLELASFQGYSTPGYSTPGFQ